LSHSWLRWLVIGACILYGRFVLKGSRLMKRMCWRQRPVLPWGLWPTA